jgi:lysophospholipid acyltransferase (LPLAT)-like uncharacterized protein
MKLNAPWITNLTGMIGSSIVKKWMSTLDYRAAFYDPTIDPTHPDYSGPKLYVFWHEYILLPLYLRGFNHLTMLLSQHRDADILVRIAGHMGFGCVRGSTYRGGAAALRELIKRSQCENLTMTPDGPRGPRRVMSQGPIYLASKLELPLVVMGFGYDRPWRLKSWDRFAIPKPGSRARLVISPQIHLPKRLDRDGLEHYRVEMESMMNRLCSEAEAWAEAGTSKQGEVLLDREPMRRPMPVRERTKQRPAVEPAPLLTSNPAAPHFSPGLRISHPQELG